MNKIKARIMGMGRRGRLLVAFAMTALTLFGSQASAFADTTDPGTAGTQSLFDGAKDNIGTILIPAVVAIVLLGSLFWLGVTWFGKGKNKGNK